MSVKNINFAPVFEYFRYENAHKCLKIVYMQTEICIKGISN